MAVKAYDATKEHAPLDRSPKSDKKGRHPNKNIKGKNPYSGNTVK
jgi:hypothetical protein